MSYFFKYLKAVLNRLYVVLTASVLIAIAAAVAVLVAPVIWLAISIIHVGHSHYDIE